MKKQLLSLFALTVVASCVDHRPIRNGLRDESIYMEKMDLTGANPRRTAATTAGS